MQNSNVRHVFNQKLDAFKLSLTTADRAAIGVCAAKTAAPPAPPAPVPTVSVTVLFFARAKELAGCKQAAYSLPLGSTVGDLRAALVASRPALAPLLSGGGSAALSVGQAFVPEAHVLRDGDEAAVIPPVSGG